MNHRVVSLLLTLACGFLLFSFVTDNRETYYVYWGQQQLSWEDFKGRAPRSSPFVALTHSAIKLSYSGENTEMCFTVETVFDPDQSWKTKQVDDYILQHEQGHFDITEIHSRMLRQQLSETRFRTYETINEEVERLFSSNFEACRSMQDAYDEETDHSKIKEEQLRWDHRIDSLLNVFSPFAGTEVKLDVSYLLH